MNHTQDKDPFLAKLLSQSTMDEPSADFTNRLMAIIEQTEVSPAEQSSFLIRYKYWLIAISAITLAIVATIFFPSFIGHQQIEVLQNFFNPYTSAFKSIATLLKTQPIISIVIIALAGLLFIDKLLSRMFHHTVQHS